ALAHPVQRDRRDMFGAVVDDVLVNLICDGKDIPFLAQLSDELELLAAEYLTGRVIWSVDDNCFGLVIKRRSKFLFIKRPIGSSQLNVAWSRARNDRVRTVILVERLENDNFISG